MKSTELEKLVSNLPKCPPVLLRTEYFNSAVLVPLVLINEEYHLLFEKRSANIRQGGEISFPGGRFDPDEDKTFLDTAVRETIEELSISHDKIEVFKQLGTLITPMNIAVEAFVGKLHINDINELNPDKSEVEHIFTIPVKWFKENTPEKYYVNITIESGYNNDDGKYVELLPVKKLGLPKVYLKPWRHKKSHVLVYPTEGEVIWGITAEIISELVKLI